MNERVTNLIIGEPYFLYSYIL